TTLNLPAPAGARTVEHQLLVAAAHARPDRARLDRVRALAARRLDWARFVELAEFHGVIQLVCASLEKAGVTPPAAVALPLRHGFRLRACDAVKKSAELLRVLECLRAASIRAIPFKGPALAASAYGNVALRVSVDLDVLVHPDDAPRAGRLLATIGYRGWD